MENTLFRCNQMKMGSHHLYDDIERLETRDSPLKDEEFN
jgi:hypothetical protein